MDAPQDDSTLTWGRASWAPGVGVVLPLGGDPILGGRVVALSGGVVVVAASLAASSFTPVVVPHFLTCRRNTWKFFNLFQIRNPMKRPK